ncbi:MAG: hypothetical protein HUU17_02770 [Chthonomonadales bacterium]|nr:hypothetical protein [Chthonomonadales bacterium]
MTLLNLGKPLNADVTSSIAALCGSKLRRVIDLDPKMNDSTPLPPQVRALLDSVGFTARAWSETQVVLSLPEDPVLATVLVAEIAGLRGRAPRIVRYRWNESGAREPIEVISLHEVRKASREQRKSAIRPA